MEEIQKVWMLLDILHKAAAAGPGYEWIVSRAREQLDMLREGRPWHDPPEAPPSYSPETDDTSPLRRKI